MAPQKSIFKVFLTQLPRPLNHLLFGGLPAEFICCGIVTQYLCVFQHNNIELASENRLFSSFWHAFRLSENPILALPHASGGSPFIAWPMRKAPDKKLGVI